MVSRSTKIVATFGPSLASPEVLLRFLKTGVNVVRLNFSHGSQKSHGENIALIRKLSKKIAEPIAILQDLQGPKVRIGRLKEASYLLKRNASFKLLKDPTLGTESAASVDYPVLYKKVKPGDTILIDDGNIVLRVQAIQRGVIDCRVIEGGVLQANKGVNVPGRVLGFPVLTQKDRSDLSFGLKQGVDYIALSMVRQAKDVLEVKKIIKKAGCATPVIAKLEQATAIDHLAGIMAASDGVMVARGDLGVEIPLEQVPLLQKKMIKMANNAGIPVITATQMLESMMEKTRPTRAEASDVANAIFDGTDAVMLSGETASGKYPLRAVQIMSRIIVAAEKELPADRQGLQKGLGIPEAVSQAVCALAGQTGAKHIVTSTLSGGSALRLSKFRPKIPILAFTPESKIARRMSLYWGIFPHEMPLLKAEETLFDAMIQQVRVKKLAKKGDLLVMVSQSPNRVSKMQPIPPTDSIKIHQM